jgi:DNA-binding MarR family transcriptional regulator
MSSRAARFESAARRAGRNRDTSRAAVTVMKAGARLAQTIERALADVDLTLPQFNVLMELAAVPDGALPMHAMVERLIGTPSSLSWLTTRMRERGLITKERDPDDARVVQLAITDTGWDALKHAMPRVFAAERQLWQEHDQADLRTLARLLDLLLTPR